MKFGHVKIGERECHFVSLCYVSNVEVTIPVLD